MICFVGCGLNRVVGAHVYDWMYEFQCAWNSLFAEEHLGIRALWSLEAQTVPVGQKCR